MSEPRFVTFSSAQDPRSWNPDATFGGDVITCLTDGDAKKAERLYKSLQAEIERMLPVINLIPVILKRKCLMKNTGNGWHSTRLSAPELELIESVYRDYEARKPKCPKHTTGNGPCYCDNDPK